MQQHPHHVFIACNGCQRRSLEAARLAAYFRTNGCEVVSKVQQADTILFVSCALDALHERESFRLIQRFIKSGKTFYLLGCLSEIIPETFRKKFGEGLKEVTLPTSRMHEIDQFFPAFSRPYASIPESNQLWSSYSIFSRAFRNFNPAKFLKTIVNPSAVKAKINSIQAINKLEKEEAAYFCLSYGCPNQCTYCAKTRAFGKLKSKSQEDCIAEYQKLLQAGTQRIAFTADDTGSYGLDLHSDLPALLASLASMHGNVKVQWIFKNFHPKWIIKYRQQLSDFVAQGILTDLVVPIESGSNNILTAMNRNHNIEDLMAALQHFRSLQPGLTLRTHIMVGFPGETERDFEDTLKAIKTIGFNWVTFFRYYDAEGTASVAMEGKVSDIVIRKRMKKMKLFMKTNNIPWL